MRRLRAELHAKWFVKHPDAGWCQLCPRTQEDYKARRTMRVHVIWLPGSCVIRLCDHHLKEFFNDVGRIYKDYKEERKSILERVREKRADK